MTVKDVYDVTTDELFRISRLDEESGDVEEFIYNVSIPTEYLNCEVVSMGFYVDSFGRHVVRLWIVGPVGNCRRCGKDSLSIFGQFSSTGERREDD